jgi:arginyl-tRNA--protein-N-Asp/Glu arginylyltransferase
MSDNSIPPNIADKLVFYAAESHECGYLPGEKAVSAFADPKGPMSTLIYSHLAEFGFRRSGEYVYAPQCPSCTQCVPLRIPVSLFKPSKSQRRIYTRNKFIKIKKQNMEFNEEYFLLYKTYLHHRHQGGGMDNPSPESFLDFLSSSWSKTNFYEFRLDGILVSVSVIDQLMKGLSAVYTFFDPDYSYLSPGQFAILWMIEEATKRDKQWLYLGYWIDNCQKMRYKINFKPAELLTEKGWRITNKSP